MTLIEQLERNVREFPYKTAIVFKDTRINYQELNDTVNRLANTLRDIGIKKGDRVCMALPRTPELVISFLAIAKAYGIAVPVNFELTPERIRELIFKINPGCLIVHSSFLSHVKEAVSEISNMCIICVEGEDRDCISWDEVLKKGNATAPSFDIKDNDIVYLNYTSGSTGESKGAVTTHANIYWNTVAAVEVLGLLHEDVHLCMFAPFAHPHEIFARPLLLGGTMVLVDKINPKSIADAISRNRVTCMMGLAPMYENLLDLLEYKTYDLSSLRIPESGGMFTRMEIIERFRERLGVPIVPVWGSTETTGIAIANRPGEPIPFGSVGKPCPYYQVRIVDENNIELPPGEIGEMIFNGPAVVRGYYELDGINCGGQFKDGWYYSGDLGRMDEDGNFYFVERKTGMMKVAGLKVYPLEVELALLEHPDIKEVAVVSVRDRLRGEVPKAIIVPRDGRLLHQTEIMSFCRARLPHYKVPRKIEIRDYLPKIGSGKINKKMLEMELV